MAEEQNQKPKPKREWLLCLLWFCCVLLTLAAFTFSMYTVKEFSKLKARINDLENQLKLARRNDMGYSKKNYMEDSRRFLQSNELWPARNNEDKTESSNGIIKTETKKPKNRSNVFIHLSGGRNDNSANATDRNVIKHWAVAHSTNHVTYNANQGCIQIVVPGYYYVYSQIQLIFKKWENAIRRHETLINSKRVLSGMFGYKSKHRKKHCAKFDANYQGGVFKLKNGDRIVIRGNKRGSLQKDSNYFGTFLLAATPF